MRPIPEKLKRQMEADPRMKMCIYYNCDCHDEYGNKPGRAEWEHAFIYDKQINEWWAIVGVCWYHHRGPGLDKKYNQFRALERMTEQDIADAQKKYPRVDWVAERQRLRKIYGN